MTAGWRAKVAPLLILAVGLSGCGLAREVDERVEQRAGIAAEKAGEQPRLRAGVRVLIHEEDRPYFGGRIIATKGDPLPRDLEGDQGIASNVGRPMTLAQWAQHITREAELPVRVVDDTAGRGGPDGSADEGLPLSYLGPLSGLLDLVTDHFGARWRYEQGVVTIQAGVMRSFTIAAPQRLVETSSSDSGAASSSSAGSGSATGTGGTVELKDDADPWDDVKATVEVLRGKANVSVSARTGTLTAWGPPADVDRIARYVEVLNDIYSRQVVLTVELVSLQLDRRENYGFDLAPVFNDAGLRVSLSGATIPGDGSSAGSVTASVIEPDGDSPFQSWEDSSALLRVLNEHGRASVEDRATLITPHGRPVEFADVTVEGYVVSTQTQLVPDAGSQTTFNTAEIEAGTKLVAVPWITDSGLIQLELGLSIQTEPTFRSVGDTTNQVELPRFQARRSHQVLRVPSGSTVMLTGFQQSSLASRRRGQAPGGLPIWGGGTDASDVNSHFLVLVTVRTTGGTSD